MKIAWFNWLFCFYLNEVAIIDWKKHWKTRLVGFGVMILGVFSILTPFFIWEWAIASLGLVLVLAGVIGFFGVLSSDSSEESYLAYIAAIVSILLGLLIFFSPYFVLSGLLYGIILFLLIDGAAEAFLCVQRKGTSALVESFSTVCSR